MNASSLKKGSTLSVLMFVDTPNGVKQKHTNVLVERVTDKYVWFKGSGYMRIARTTIDKNPNYYKIVKI